MFNEVKAIAIGEESAKRAFFNKQLVWSGEDLDLLGLQIQTPIRRLQTGFNGDLHGIRTLRTSDAYYSNAAGYGDRVGRAKDVAGDFDAYQPDASARPILKRSSGGYFLEFNGDGEFLFTTLHPGTRALGSSFTWEFWVNYYSFGADTGSFGNPQTNPRMYCQLDSSDGDFRTAVGDEFWTSMTIPQTHKWYFITIRLSANGEVGTFLNGEHKDNRTIGWSGEATNGPFCIGRGHSTSARWFHGASGEHRIWTYARTQSEILQDMHKRPNGDEHQLIAYWSL